MDEKSAAKFHYRL